MTKEMRPAHRIDVLSGGLEYYVIQRKQKLGMYMCTYAFILYIYSAYIPPKAKTSHFKSQGLVNVAQYLECDNCFSIVISITEKKKVTSHSSPNFIMNWYYVQTGAIIFRYPD